MEMMLRGNGVNVAARLEGIAEPGGICLSEDVYRQVRGKVTAEFVDLGEQSLKNIAGLVRAYRIDRTDANEPERGHSPMHESLRLRFRTGPR
jgi:adenylate cyclase